MADRTPPTPSREWRLAACYIQGFDSFQLEGHLAALAAQQAVCDEPQDGYLF